VKVLQGTLLVCILCVLTNTATAEERPHETSGFHKSILTTMAESRIMPQDFQPAQRPKRKRGPQPSSSNSPTTFFSHNQFSVLSDSESDAEENSTPSQPNILFTRITPIVIYSLLTNHSATLKQVNSKLTSPVEVKSKTNRLLLYTKSSSDYKILLSEIQKANLPYHTDPLPEAILD
jgi:hypothetical protein